MKTTVELHTHNVIHVTLCCNTQPQRRLCHTSSITIYSHVNDSIKYGCTTLYNVYHVAFLITTLVLEKY